MKLDPKSKKKKNVLDATNLAIFAWTIDVQASIIINCV
jgi:hypothetical protein